MTSPFHVDVSVIDNGEGVWKTAVVCVFETADGSPRKIGQYPRAAEAQR